MKLSMDTPLIRHQLSPNRPYAVVDELEPDADRHGVPTTTVFLTASQCPVGCHMCDLWQNTLAEPTPIGAIPRQLDWAFSGRRSSEWVKLYNSGNFFDPRSIPPADYAGIAQRCSSFSRVIVENHPRIGTSRVEIFRDLLAGKLEIAVGLETVQPRWLDRLGKQMTRDDFDRYARWLKSVDVDLRVFLIIGMPGLSVRESIRWARLSVRHAVTAGARHVSLIPSRPGQGWGGQASGLPSLSLDDLAEIQGLAIDDAQGRAVVTVDLWDVQTHPESSAGHETIERLRGINLSQQMGTA